ncbi:probable LRR receptor-like serine/threonine-protein kinase At1g67720 [Cryptomeria japonica]|uniref:probable LRR receptor-like serine/threonine-protein kinase At1g67720 n=1 Tax=Cryptomeria japonica TaxID=3369 RepID=UPI0027DA547C|nr:probable LRR receptor-like serine/threonine-protein kinase At1g67720 [Cryptomeria japonica]
MSVMEWTSVCLLLITTFTGLFTSIHSNQDGFLNINCGSIYNVTGKNHLHWISDSPFIKTRNIWTTSSTEPLFVQFWTLAYFPSSLSAKKYCYLLPMKPHQNYLVRATFSPDNTLPLATFFDLLIEGMKWTNVDLTGIDNETFRYYEIILAAKSENLSLCLARNSKTEQNHSVFISTIELRPLESSMYSSTDFQRNALVLVGGRLNFGASSALLRYPDDPFDRFWASAGAAKSTVNITAEDEQTNSLGRGLVNKPPLNVSRTAIAMEKAANMTILDEFPDVSVPGIYSFVLYFCNINQTNLTQRFAAFINENQISDYLELKFLQCRQVNKDLKLNPPDPINIILHPSPESDLGPFINAAEIYRKFDLQTTTYSRDVVAVRKIAEAVSFPDDWTGGDPCLPDDYSSTGITCSKDDPPRVIIINLTGMHLNGTIPTNIADLTALTQLLLGNNNLSGYIPDLGSLKNLSILQLQNNQLTGEIPRSLEKLQMLNQLFLQDNKFEGTVSKGLVRPNLDLRVDPQNNIPAGSQKIKGWLIGLLIGCSVVLALIILSGVFLWRHKHHAQPFPTTNVPTLSKQHIFADEKIQNDHHRLAIEYTEEDIKTSTNNYSTLIGKGSFGSVFYGRLSGYEVAVKILKTESNQGLQEFQNEVAILSRLYHKNLVNLIGYCRQSIMALVYEYMPCGTLADHLYGIAKLKNPLDWHTRLNIAQQAADGLFYLHQGCYPPIIHRDIKCNNILLDSRKSAKVADFGISKLLESTHGYISTEVKGTMGYLDPEYFATSTLNEKTDVYSFGVVLLEIISGVSPKDGIVQSAHNMLLCGKLAELMDSSLDGRYNLESAWKVAEIAYMCVEKESTNRPKMSAVVKELEEAVALAYGDNSYSASHTVASFKTGDMPRLR